MIRKYHLLLPKILCATFESILPELYDLVFHALFSFSLITTYIVCEINVLSSAHTEQLVIALAMLKNG